MSAIFQSKWFAARLVILTASALGVPLIPRAQSNVNWGACFLMSAFTFISVFIWLAVSRSISRYNKIIDWSEPYSWWGPFFPMRRYPLRFLLLGSSSLILGGLVALLSGAIFQQGHQALPGTVFFLGMSIGLAVALWTKVFVNSSERILEK
jgi:hypothetical protein